MRRLVAPGMRILGWLSARSMSRRIQDEERVRRDAMKAFGIEENTPVTPYDEALRERVRTAARVSGAAIVRTSGSTSQPKELLYTPRRLRKLKKAFALATARIVRARRVRRPIVFTLASPKEDDSLTSIYAWQHGRMPALLDCWVTPHMILSHPEITAQTERYGLTAVRLWALVLSNPGWLYSTNPSTQALFFRRLDADWSGARTMLQDWYEGKLTSPMLRRLAVRIVASGWKGRMVRCLESKKPWPLHDWWPALEVRSSWDGGSVGSFLVELERLLPNQVQFVPMFSMSTETIETLPVFHGERLHFLPVAPGVLTEFLPEDAEDDPTLLLSSQQLKVGQHYSMVVSDAYGLRRYQTEDIFECIGHVEALPDLAFRRRRGLTWSFTGEKITGEQLTHVYRRLRDDGLVDASTALSCVPTDPGNGTMPGYVILLAEIGDAPDPAPSLSTAFDRVLGEINREYADKRASGRLAVPRLSRVAYDDVAAALDPRADGREGTAQRAWDSQFKLLPLLRQTWEELALSK